MLENKDLSWQVIREPEDFPMDDLYTGIWCDWFHGKDWMSD